MKIALITDNLNSGGAQRQLVTLAIGLKEHGYEVTFIVYNPGYHYEHVLQANNITLHKVLKKRKYDLSLIPRLIRTIRRGNIRAVIVFLFAPTIVAVLSAVLSARRIKIIASERSFSQYRETDLITKVARRCYVFTNHVTVNSRSQLSFLQSNYPQYAEKLTYIPNGLDLTRFVPLTSHNTNPILEVLCIGHTNAVKNTKLVIHALSHLRRRTGAPFRLTWIGRNFDEASKQNPYFHECVSMINQLQLEDSWQWISETKDLIPFYQRADLVLHASIGEGFSNVVMEALACGIPVIASDVNDNSLIIKHNVNGFLFPSGNSEAIAEILFSYMKTDRIKRKEFSIAARTTAEKHFSQQIMINRYIALLNQNS